MEILKVTALSYLQEALAAQEYEACQELVDTAKNLGVDQGDISAVITDYLNANNPGQQKGNRLRS
jgi:chromosome condensin MukBEF complex kleisin-like MukF subunit